ncbi:uncharacterized protein EV420DRAFT_1506603 [Desarmillaria tabescens]|uniref:F-box domain-containing protein n=1 Tax=Armillaria tabescens TaxID=1929756 RepID=A0AA39NJW9_ARMTA|nr:uncharacterized protein EV420DRAFT_1506603 [Desarmillaria tabescens]KAK0466998.1 hypothetical protein EV420DRAFT_1506603 [Desarmillaria tabescens]
MHQVLLIDEILQEIFHWCSVLEVNVLSQAARTCQAWKEPALDALYRQLPSVEPLWSLLPSVNGREEIIPSDKLQVFHSYARRVRHISHTTRSTKILQNPSMYTALCGKNSYIFPNLTTVKFRLSKSSSHPSLCLSPRLRELQLDVGFSAKDSSSEGLEYLREIALVACHLQSLTFRGLVPGQFDSIIRSMSTLHTLLLRTGRSVTVDVITSISTLPHLNYLELHAQHLEAFQIEDIWRSTSGSLRFPALQNLRLRSTPDFAILILQKMQSIAVHTLSLDIETRDQITPFWLALFNVMQERFSTSLEHVSIMHYLELDYDIPLDIDLINTIDFAALRSLARLRELRYLHFDTTVPMDIGTEDVTQMVAWWPNLRHLEMWPESVVDCDENSPRINSGSAIRLTLDVLPVISASLPKLESVALPLDTSGITEEIVSRLQVPGHRTLQAISFSYPHAPDTNLLPLYLRKLFPALRHVRRASGHDGLWASVAAKACYHTQSAS